MAKRQVRTAKLAVSATRVRASSPMRVMDTGTFGAHRRPKIVGVSDDVAYATKMTSKAARRAERVWLRSLPKGVTV